MRNIFKRRRPTPAPAPIQISTQDRLVAAWFGFTPTEWAKLPSIVRVDKREEYFAVQGMAS